MGQGSKFFVSLSDLNLDRTVVRDWADLRREPDWRCRARFLDRILTLLPKLPPAERDVIELYFAHGKRQETIARLLQISQQAVSHRLYTAYRRIGFLLGQPDVTPEQMRADLGMLLANPFGVDVLCSFAATGNQTETARRLGVPQQRVCWHLQASLRALRESRSFDAMFYVALFERLLQRRTLSELPARRHDGRLPRTHSHPDLAGGAGSVA